MAVGLVACGGGGGGGASGPAVPASADLTGSAGCTVALNASTCAPTITWIIRNASSPAVKLGAATVAQVAAGSLGSTTVAAYDGSSKLQELTIDAVCATGLVAVGGVCVTKPVARYTDKVYAIWNFNYLHSVSKAGLKPLTNKTSFKFGGAPLFNCWQPKGRAGTQTDGTILASCQDAASLRRHYLVIDPINDELSEYSGAVPATLACTENVNKTWTCPANSDWVSVQGELPIVTGPFLGYVAVQVSDGWFFTASNDGRNTRFQSTADGSVVIVQQSIPGDDVVKLLQSFSN